MSKEIKTRQTGQMNTVGSDQRGDKGSIPLALAYTLIWRPLVPGVFSTARVETVRSVDDKSAYRRS
jgi:hypothetical protein